MKKLPLRSISRSTIAGAFVSAVLLCGAPSPLSTPAKPPVDPLDGIQLTQAIAGRCCTQMFWCVLYSPVLLGQPCGCLTPSGPVPGFGC